jgi:uncharacterized protein YjiS (DUF1127 family)
MMMTELSIDRTGSRLVRSLRGFWMPIFSRLGRYRQGRRDWNALSELTDSQLEDIGLSRVFEGRIEPSPDARHES